MKLLSSFARLLALTALVTSPSALAQAPATNAPPAAEEARTAPVAPATTDADPALWAVRDADTTIYLFGTVHVLRPGLSWFDEAVRTAFDASDELKLEVVLPDDPAALGPSFLAAGSYPAGTTLTSRLSAGQRAALEAGLAPTGVPVATFDAYEPWFVSLMLSQQVFAAMGFTPENGAEKTLTEAAAAAGKPVSGFETIEQQLGYLEGAPESEQIVGLLAFFEQMGKARVFVDRLMASWTEGQPDDTAELMNEALEKTPQTARILLTDRNRRWAEALAARMEQPGTVFVAVGAGHLAGEGSVQTFLAERGLTAERVVY